MAFSLAFTENARHNVSLTRLSAELGLPDHDIILFGDGSGVGGWKRMGGGWACSIIERDTGWRERCWGGWSRCSIAVAELSAYQQAWMLHENTRGPALRQRLGRPPHILVMTDSQVTVHHARTGLRQEIDADTAPIWAGLRSLCFSTGATMTFRHLPRLSTMLNWVADRISSRARIAIEQESVGELTDNSTPVDFAEMNPLR